MQSMHPPSSHMPPQSSSQSQGILGSHSKLPCVRPCFNVPECSRQGYLESQMKHTGSLPRKHPGTQDRNYSIKPQPVLNMVTDLPSARSVVPSPGTPPHLHPPKLPYNPYKQDPTALSPPRLSPHSQMPPDSWLTESLPPRLYDTPIDWNMVRQTSMQRSLINPFAEPRRRRVTRDILQLHIPPETWYGAGLACSMSDHPERNVPTSPAWSPSMLVSSMGGALHALRSPVRNAWSPVYTREELLRQQEEQAPRTFFGDLQKMLSSFWRSPKQALPPPKYPRQSRRQNKRQSGRPERRQKQKKACQTKSMRANATRNVCLPEDNCIRPVYPGLGRMGVDTNVRKSASLSHSTPRKLQEATAVTPFNIESNSSTAPSPPQPQFLSQLPAENNPSPGQHASTRHNPAHLMDDSDTRLYGSRFNPSYKRRYSPRTPPRTLHAATTANPTNRAVSMAKLNRRVVFHTVKRAAMFMRADRRDDALEAMKAIRQWLEQHQVQDFLIAVGVWATVVVLLKWLDVSPSTIARTAPNRAEVFKDWGFSYVRVSEERLWSVGEQR